ILAEYERGVIFRLGKLLADPKGPGVILVFRPIDRIVRISLRTLVHDVPPQDVITRDNVSVKVSAVAYFRVIDPRRAVVEVENYLYATSQLAQAAAVTDREPQAMTLRCLQTLTEIASEQSSTIVFPIPLEFMRLLRPPAEK